MSQTQPQNATPASPTPVVAPASPPPPGSRSWLMAIWPVGQLVVSLAITVGVLIYLLSAPASKPEPPHDDRSTDVEPVRVTGPYLIRIESNTPLARKIQTSEVHPTRISAPVLTVTGTVVASLRPKNGKNGEVNQKSNDFWQFNSPEVLTTFTDWQKAKADVAFTKSQFTRIRDAASERTKSQRELVATVAKLEAAGTETKKQLAIERATLRQYEIQEQKEIYESETAIRVAERSEIATSRQLQQVGLDPALLGSITSDVDLVMADVPEGFLGRVKVGDGCQARFFGIPDQMFVGRVKSIAPVLAKDRRSLRVLFTVDDLQDQLRPGMFAEIGLGTDPRDAQLAPAEGVIHVGRTDYLLVATPEANVWRVTPVEVGEVRQSRVEIIKGLTLDSRVIGQGAILLKPVVARAVQPGALGGGGP